MRPHEKVAARFSAASESWRLVSGWVSVAFASVLALSRTWQREREEGALSGLHRSPFHGYSAEFSQYRHYRPGDDLKYVDWKLLARTDRVYTKQFLETTNVRAQIVLDASASMGFTGGADRRLNRTHRAS